MLVPLNKQVLKTYEPSSRKRRRKILENFSKQLVKNNE